MIVQARRSGFISITGAAGSVDGAHLIKVYRHVRKGPLDRRLIITILCRRIPGSAALTGKIFTGTPRHTVPNSVIPRIRATLTTTSPPR